MHKAMKHSILLALGLVLFRGFASAAEAQTPVILISIDTLRADHLSAYGYRKIQTPNIDSFAREGTIFTRVSSQIPLTLPSHFSLFTSTYPFENGVEENAQIAPGNTITLALVLRSHGYKTAAFIGSSMLDRRFGLDEGFDEYDSPFGAATSQSNPYSLRVRRDGAIVLRAAAQWLGAHRDQPVFVFIHLFDLHTPYRLARSTNSSEPETVGYDAELAYIDQLLGHFRQSLEQNGWWKKSLIVLLADHGESLGDHGESSHGYFIYQSTLHVPLLVHWPEDSFHHPNPGAEPAGLIDVAPTILDAVHVPAPASFKGVSLFKETGSHAIVSESVYARDSFHWAALRSIRIGNWKYIDTPRPELFDLTKDSAEQSNLIRGNAAEASSLRSKLGELMARSTRTQPATARDSSRATRSQLQSLGYLAGSSNEPALRNAPDPKDRLAEYQLFDHSLDAMYSGRLDGAIRGFRQLLAMDPKNLPARATLGDAHLRAGMPDKAIAEWAATLAADPKYASVAQSLGELYVSRREWTKARPYFQQALAAAPGDAVVSFELGVVERNLGMFKEALEHLRASCGESPSSDACDRELRQAEAGSRNTQ
jgi:choline-sulfatase